MAQIVLTQIILFVRRRDGSTTRAPSWTKPLPAAAPPSDMAIYQLPTGTYETRAAFAVQGGSFGDIRHFAVTALLITHPKGDLLIDAGFGSHVGEHLAMLPRIQRAP